ncbi:hypothetical protein [Pantoea agglomerans]|uniref:hypothetical protein n=1 Tax=Enterobacter agglomerans TaxID=549 RepID=UPI001111708C|nr:hypothetical protein [Pantoea agglomerans]
MTFKDFTSFSTFDFCIALLTKSLSKKVITGFLRETDCTYSGIYEKSECITGPVPVEKILYEMGYAQPGAGKRHTVYAFS